MPHIRLILSAAALLAAAALVLLSDSTGRPVLPLHADDGVPVIHKVSPAPPVCLIRESSVAAHRTLTIRGENLDQSDDWRLVFLVVQTGDRSLHFREQVNWESDTQIAVDIRSIDEYLPPDDFIVLRARIMGGDPYGPLTDWTREFTLARDERDCGFAKPTPSPGPTMPPRGVPGDQWADLVLGKPGFSQIGPNQVVPYAIFNPGGVAVDRSTDPNRAYIWDSGNSRILGIDLAECYEARERCSATVVLGQPSGFDHGGCNGDSGVQTYPFRAQATSETLCGIPDTSLSPVEEHTFVTMAVGANGDLYVPDSHNHRVLRYDSPFENDATADEVWGQPDLSGMTCNRGDFERPTAETLCFHADSNRSRLNRYGNGVELDATGDLWVADGGNNRVVRFPLNLETGAIAKSADLVLGQDHFAARTAAAAMDRFHAPSSIRFGSNGWLYVVDSYNDRVQVFQPPFESGMAASHSFGADFHQPTAVELDPLGRGVWINDSGNHMIELWNHEGTEVLIVLGKESYVPDRQCGNTNSVSAEGGLGICSSSGGIGLDSQGNLLAPIFLYPSDVIRFPTSAYRGEAGQVIQPDDRLFYPPSSLNWKGRSGLQSARGVAVWEDQLIVADIDRLMVWNGLDTLVSGKPADVILGDTYRNERWSSCCGRLKVDGAGRLWSLGFEGRRFLDIYDLPLTDLSVPVHTIWTNQRLFPVLGSDESIALGQRIFGIAPVGNGEFVWLSDTDNNRVLRIRDPLVDPIVDVILGQTDVHGSHCNRDETDYTDAPWQTRRGLAVDLLCVPGALSIDKFNNLWVSDHSLEVNGNHRLLAFSADSFPPDNSSTIFAPNAVKVFEKHLGAPGGALHAWEKSEEIEHEFNGPLAAATWEAAFDGFNRMVVGFNSYIGGRFVAMYDDPLGLGSEPVSYLRDIGGMPFTATFDSNGNLYVGDINRSRLMIYQDPFDGAPDMIPTLPPSQADSGALAVPANPSMTRLISPAPGGCLVRRSDQGGQTMLKFEVNGLPFGHDFYLQFRKVASAETKEMGFYDVGAFSAGEAGRYLIDFNVRRFGSHLWAGLKRVVLYARVTRSVERNLDQWGNGFEDVIIQEPITGWSQPFVVALIADACRP